MSFFIPSSLKILFFKANFTHSLGLKHQQDELSCSWKGRACPRRLVHDARTASCRWSHIYIEVSTLNLLLAMQTRLAH